MKSSHNSHFKIITSIVALAYLTSCVPLNRFKDLQNENSQCVSQRDSLDNALTDAQTTNTELQGELDKTLKIVDSLKRDTTNLGNKLRELGDERNRLDELNNNLMQKQSNLIKENAREAKRILAELQDTRIDLQRREDKLDSLKRSLEAERLNIERMKGVIGLKDMQISEKEQQLSYKDEQLRDLKEIIRKKDSATMAIKNKISAALAEFEGNGLKVEFKNGKIFVSLDESLLFRVGRSEVNPRGIQALIKLAKVLEANEDLDIMVEGHTDVTGEEKLNWELSAQRALSITYILIDSASIAKDRVGACGRGQFVPIDTAYTPEAWSKNRRSEIILTPKLNELYELIEETE